MDIKLLKAGGLFSTESISSCAQSSHCNFLANCENHIILKRLNVSVQLCLIHRYNFAQNESLCIDYFTQGRN